MSTTAECIERQCAHENLLAEAITALQWLYDVAVVEHDEDYGAVTNAAAVLHKAHLAKEQQS